MTAFSSLPVPEVVGEPGDDDRGWPFTMPPVAQLMRDGLELTELTILDRGERGRKVDRHRGDRDGLRAQPRGGSKVTRESDRPTESPLHERIRLVRGLSRSRWGYFLRAETMHGLLTYLGHNPSWHAPETRYHERSHGQGFNELLATKLGHMAGRGGFLVMDEPEAGLSFLTQVQPGPPVGGAPRRRYPSSDGNPLPDPHSHPRRPHHPTGRERIPHPCLGRVDDRRAVSTLPHRPRLLRLGVSLRQTAARIIHSRRG